MPSSTAARSSSTIRRSTTRGRPAWRGGRGRPPRGAAVGDRTGGLPPIDGGGLDALAMKLTGGRLRIGTCVSANPAMTDDFYRGLLPHFGRWTFENAGKWQWIEPEPGRFAWQAADAIAALAHANGAEIHGHTLCWQEALPAWVTHGLPAKGNGELDIDKLTKR